MAIEMIKTALKIKFPTGLPIMAKNNLKRKDMILPKNDVGVSSASP